MRTRGDYYCSDGMCGLMMEDDMLFIDAENYLILARTGHPAELHTVAQDYAVGLSAAKRIAKKMREKHPHAKVDVFWCDGPKRILENVQRRGSRAGGKIPC